MATEELVLHQEEQDGLRGKRERDDTDMEEQVIKKQFNGVEDNDVEMTDEDPEHEMVAILDAGAQYGKVIDRRIRELNVESVILPISTPVEQLRSKNLIALIISGSGDSVNDVDAPSCDPAIFTLGIPILGICYGYHIIIKHFGGQVTRKKVREDGQFEVTLDTTNLLFKELTLPTQKVLLTHGDSAQKLPDCLVATGWSDDLITAISHQHLQIYGVQFHPEVELTVNGQQILHTFLYQIANCQGLFHLTSREEKCLEYIKAFVGDGHVLSLVSGGVDSTVCTALITKAIGPKNVTAVHIDNGFLRKEESEQVLSSLKDLNIDPQIIHAAHTFSTASTIMNYRDHEGHVYRQGTPLLNAVTSAEEKRHIIGDTFVNVASEILRDLERKGQPVFLAQGTLRPDLIESASSLASANAHVIKTHHNDTPLVREMRLRGLVVEPLRDFHKDEVRALGNSLGVPPEIVYRHPFPGPGLSIRIICQDEPYLRDDFTSINNLLTNITTFNQAILKPDALTKLIQECTSQNEQEFLIQLTSSISLEATVLPIYTVGVQGDSRTYSYVAALSSDEVAPWSQLMKLAKLIPRICHGVNRVVWIFGEKVVGPINDVTPTHLTNGVLATLREADYVAHTILKSHDLQRAITQMPIILIPIHFDRNHENRPFIPSCQRSIVIRTFITSDFMTGIPAVPGQELPIHVIEEMVEKIKTVPGISRVLYDLTPKPPGTTEWE